MLKIAAGFIVFAAVALFVIVKGGDKLDMAGEQQGAQGEHTAAPAPAAAK